MSDAKRAEAEAEIKNLHELAFVAKVMSAVIRSGQGGRDMLNVSFGVTAWEAFIRQAPRDMIAAAKVHDDGSMLVGGVALDYQADVAALSAIVRADDEEIATITMDSLDIAIEALTTAIVDAFVGVVPEGIMALFGGKGFATGGPVKGGKAYLVGEQGRETFVPGPGSILKK